MLPFETRAAEAAEAKDDNHSNHQHHHQRFWIIILKIVREFV